MRAPIDRRQFLRIAGTSLGLGALYQVAPGWASNASAADTARRLAKKNGEAVTPFSFVQLSDPHVGFAGPPNPTGTRAFERAVEVVNALPRQPELIFFTGDLTHDSEEQPERLRRMRRFQQIAGGLRVKARRSVPGEHDAAIDGGALYREVFGETTYSFDHRGVHFVALDNVSRPKPEVGPGAARLAAGRPLPLRAHHPPRGLHAPAAVRPQAGVGMVHPRRRRGDEGALRLRERDGALRPHPPRARARHARLPPRGGALTRSSPSRIRTACRTRSRCPSTPSTRSRTSGRASSAPRPGAPPAALSLAWIRWS